MEIQTCPEGFDRRVWQETVRAELKQPGDAASFIAPKNAPPCPKTLMNNLNAPNPRHFFLQPLQNTIPYSHRWHPAPAARTTGHDFEGHQELAEGDRDAGLFKSDLHNPITEIHQCNIATIGFQNRAYALLYDSVYHLKRRAFIHLVCDTSQDIQVTVLTSFHLH